jgi:hypothetical protein
MISVGKSPSNNFLLHIPASLKLPVLYLACLGVHPCSDAAPSTPALSAESSKLASHPVQPCRSLPSDYSRALCWTLARRSTHEHAAGTALPPECSGHLDSWPGIGVSLSRRRPSQA